jgi:hypothetical protein
VLAAAAAGARVVPARPRSILHLDEVELLLVARAAEDPLTERSQAADQPEEMLANR